jgi:hypothetical protein
VGEEEEEGVAGEHPAVRRGGAAPHLLRRGQEAGEQAVDQLGRTPPPSLAPYAVGACMTLSLAREPVLRLPPPSATWDVREASSSASSS